MSRRRNGEGSIYPVKDSHGRVTGYRGYVWCTKPDGERYRKYVKGKTYEATQRAWFKLRDEASHGPVSSDVPELGDFLSYWLREIVQPNLAPKTYEKYELFVRLHIVPHLGHKRLDQAPGQGHPAMDQQAQRHLPVLRAREGRCPASIQATVLRDR